MDTRIGQIVHYKLSADDVTLIQTWTSAHEEAFTIPEQLESEEVREGEVFPALIVKAFSNDKASVQVALPGVAPIYFRARQRGASEGCWQWSELSEAGPYRDELPMMQQGSPQTARR